MDKIDLIIENIEYAKILKESAHQNELLEEALAAARELRDLKIVAKHVCNLWINPETSEYEVDRCTHPINEVIPVYTALAQPEQDKQCKHCGGKGCVACDARCLPKREWVGLTVGEVIDIQNCNRGFWTNAAKIEQLLKDKNT